MTATELRIGNLFNHIGDIRTLTDVEFEIRLKFGFDNCKPILITEEWLLKFGFEKYTNNEFSFETKDFEISFLNGELKLLCGDYAENPISLNNQKYVHQLQNLYFALTNEELTIKSE